MGRARNRNEANLNVASLQAISIVLPLLVEQIDVSHANPGRRQAVQVLPMRAPRSGQMRRNPVFAPNRVASLSRWSGCSKPSASWRRIRAASRCDHRASDRTAIAPQPCFLLHRAAAARGWRQEPHRRFGRRSRYARARCLATPHFAASRATRRDNRPRGRQTGARARGDNLQCGRRTGRGNFFATVLPAPGPTSGVSSCLRSCSSPAFCAAATAVARCTWPTAARRGAIIAKARS
jgi:hypothetical protein